MPSFEHVKKVEFEKNLKKFYATKIWHLFAKNQFQISMLTIQCALKSSFYPLEPKNLTNSRTLVAEQLEETTSYLILIQYSIVIISFAKKRFT